MIILYLTAGELRKFLAINSRRGREQCTAEEFEQAVISLFAGEREFGSDGNRGESNVLRPGFKWQLNGYALQISY